MDVHIEELHTSVDAVDAEALLSPAVLTRIVAAVKRQLDDEARGDLIRADETDLRSVVERQRAPLGGTPGVPRA
ncbi:MAG: hypothetical protein M3237_15165 [Actinomycetota bacterium]|nr:hypothetical protein [Actinomycetota bacterium]